MARGLKHECYLPPQDQGAAVVGGPQASCGGGRSGREAARGPGGCAHDTVRSEEHFRQNLYSLLRTNHRTRLFAWPRMPASPAPASSAEADADVDAEASPSPPIGANSLSLRKRTELACETNWASARRRLSSTSAVVSRSWFVRGSCPQAEHKHVSEACQRVVGGAVEGSLRPSA